MDQPLATITDAYLAEQQKLHQNPRYGVASIGYAPLVASLLRLGQCQSLSDYGAGKCKLKVALGLGDKAGVAYYPYDPAFPEYGPPREADLVTCIDVLEHIELDLLDSVLDEIAGITTRLALLTVHTGPAVKLLGDGRNAHLIQESPTWWVRRLVDRFDLLHLQCVRKGFFVIAAPSGSYRQLTQELDLQAIARAAGRARPRSKSRLRRLLRLVGRGR